MNTKIFYTILIVTFLYNHASFAQDEDLNDWESWNSVGLKYKLNKKCSFDLQEHIRFKENISEIDKYFTQLGTRYKINNHFKVGAAARYISKNDNTGNIQGYENYFRFHLEALYNHKINNFKFEYRLRYQNKNELGKDDYANQHLRLKGAIVYNIKNWKLDPEISAEIFNHFEKNEENGFDKYRITIGTAYNMKNFGKIKLYYRYKKELNVNLPETKNIIGLKYTYTIKNN